MKGVESDGCESDGWSDGYSVDEDAGDFLATMPEEAELDTVAFFRTHCVYMLFPSELEDCSLVEMAVDRIECLAELDEQRWALAFIAWTIECRPELSGASLERVLDMAAESTPGARLAHHCFKALASVNELRRETHQTVLLCRSAARAILEHMRLNPETCYAEHGAAMLYEMCLHAKMKPRDDAMGDSVELLLTDEARTWLADYDDYVSALANEGLLNGERSAVRSVQGFVHVMSTQGYIT